MPPTRRSSAQERSRELTWRLCALAAALLCAAGCKEKLDSIDLPGLELPGLDGPDTGAAPRALASAAPRALASAAPRALASAAPRALASAAPRAAPSLECDELPSEEEERRAKLPPLTALGKAVPAEPWEPPPYEVLPGVTLPAKIAAKLEQIDRGYARRTREHLVITSGTRDANRQARAMFTKLRLGEDLLQLYRHKAAVQEIKKAYQASSRKPPEQVVAAMEAVIQDQIDRGIYVSAHLRRGAVDVRNRTMSSKERRAFLESAAEIEGVLVIEETTPPHYHLQID
ncbi:hypothetical protein WME89_50535 [Sorangium sp. So ce321]|uniref:hypothetical protein n=1 Tax=Sorangium sp. So ce321 TaxID=3133300 RepID=UPI003F63662D